VVVGALAGLPFPFTPRNNAVLALVTVGIPTLALAVWVGPLRAPRSVVPWILRYALPAGVLVALLGLPVLPLAFAGNDASVGRSIMTTFTVFAGIALIPLLFPAVSDRSGPVGRGGDRRPALLALAMLLLYGAIAATPLARDFFELRLIPAPTVATLFIYTLIWFAVVLAVLRLGLPDRLAARLPRLPADRDGASR
jgi:cation-transporting P-type ATPase E